MTGPPLDAGAATVVVFGVAGRLGQTVAAEAAGRGHRVVGVACQAAATGVPHGVCWSKVTPPTWTSCGLWQSRPT
ncbi:MAG: hypothetical protein ACREQ5_23505 [Candidatus Dormibacteria bacterium]